MAHFVFRTVIVVVMTTVISVTRAAPQSPVRNDDTNPDCAKARELRGEAIWTNKVVKADGGQSYRAELSMDDYVTIFGAQFQFLDTLYGNQEPCEKEYNVCLAAASYEDSCLPLWFVEDGLRDDELGSELFQKFRKYFYQNEDVTSCVEKYMYYELESCQY